MKRLIVTAIGSAVLALGIAGANASEDTEYERAGWAALEREQEGGSPFATDHNFIAPAQ